MGEPAAGTKATFEFATESYNYNTHSDEHPKNLLLLCTMQGVAMQQDGEDQRVVQEFHRNSACLRETA